MSRCSSSGNMQLNAWNCRRRGDLKPDKGTGFQNIHLLCHNCTQTVFATHVGDCAGMSELRRERSACS
jgi:hypothetical protein